jgi:hypothetical protein
MKEYHKIQTVFKRDEKTKKIILNDFTLPEFELLKDIQWEWTEKVDGTNTRVYWNGESVVFGGKTADAQMPMHLLYVLQEQFEGTKNKFLLKEVFGDATDVCLYGEGYGFKIQSYGKNYLPDSHSFALFDVRINGFWLDRKDVEDIATKLDLDLCPVVGHGTLVEAIEAVKSGWPSRFGDFLAEGLVLRPTTELLTKKGERIITKIKHRDFL